MLTREKHVDDPRSADRLDDLGDRPGTSAITEDHPASTGSAAASPTSRQYRRGSSRPYVAYLRWFSHQGSS